MNPKLIQKRDGAPLTDKLLTAVARHLNRDHLEDMLACAKATAEVDWAEQASVSRLDADGISLEVIGPSQVQSLRIDFPEQAKGVLSLRNLLGVIITESRAHLGWAAAIDDE